MGEKLLIASDHAGYDLKKFLKENRADFEWIDLGTHSHDSVHYPDFGYDMAKAIEQGDAQRGVLICGTGIGISISANRSPKVRAAVCTDSTMAKLTRLHNDANVLALGARLTGTEIVLDIFDTFMNTEFEGGGRHAIRVGKLNEGIHND